MKSLMSCFGLGIFFLLCWCVMGGADASEQERTLKIVLGKKVYRVSTQTMRKQLKVQTLTHPSGVYYKKRMTYLYVRLPQVLKLVGIDFSKVASMRFHCRDGFIGRWNPQNPKDLLLALREKGNPKLFTDVAEGKETVNPGPFFVMTPDPKTRKQWDWPHQVFQITVSYQRTKTLSFPVGAKVGTAVHKGYQLFSSVCLACHTVNLDGGQIGPEFNIPKNITEYRSRTYLRTFIQHPTSYRAKSRMPSFSYLNSEQLDQILAYLTHMKKHKRFDKLRK
ncbi:MAG: cytochrome c [Myxococcota bacterium]